MVCVCLNDCRALSNIVSLLLVIVCKKFFMLVGEIRILRF